MARKEHDDNYHREEMRGWKHDEKPGFHGRERPEAGSAVNPGRADRKSSPEDNALLRQGKPGPDRLKAADPSTVDGGAKGPGPMNRENARDARKRREMARPQTPGVKAPSVGKRSRMVD
jgi:hypothetical protein